ncbi:AsnC family transcriptional regulator [Candidatus Woesearchaeota archaeon]|nr:AsnC family transcriptional regulator [Candidatus Woesearchaeota archaeon]
MKEIDLKDRKILYQLDVNARQSNARIGKKVRLSPEVVFHRIRNLEKRGIIEGYYATLDPTKFGYKAYRVYVKTQDLTLETEKELFDWLVANKKTYWVGRIEGAWDVDFLIWVKDDYEFEQEWLRFLQQFRKYVHSKLIQIYTRLHQFHRPLLLGKTQDEEPEVVLFSQDRATLDQTDFKILKAIATDARGSLTSLSKKVGLSPKNVSYRLKALLRKGVIRDFRAKLNVEKLGYQSYKIEIDLNDHSVLRKLYSFAKLHPFITYINQVIGLADFDADVEIPNGHTIMELLGQLRKEFGAAIREIRYFTIRKVYKISYLPEL